MVHRTNVGSDPSGDTGHATVVGNREKSSEESRFGVVCAVRSPAKRSPRDSRNIALALALLALAIIMFLVTIVKFEERLNGNGLFQTQGETKQPRARTSTQGFLVSGVGPFFSRQTRPPGVRVGGGSSMLVFETEFEREVTRDGT